MPGLDAFSIVLKKHGFGYKNKSKKVPRYFSTAEKLAIARAFNKELLSSGAIIRLMADSETELTLSIVSLELYQKE